MPSSLDFYYIGIDEVMTGPGVFDWDGSLEPRLAASAARSRHAVVRLLLDFPGRPSMVPGYLIDGGLTMNPYGAHGGGFSPDYSDASLLQALGDLVASFGARYDGDPRLGFVQAGLLGFWGEWHTYTDGSGETEGWIPEAARELVVASYADAFSVTRLQVRYPHSPALEAGFGLHDDSFAHSTLDGAANGGTDVGWFFWPQVRAAGAEDFWRHGAMGGELRPELQAEVFSGGYSPGEFRQDFDLCASTTHATYMLNYHAFAAEGGYGGNDLGRAVASGDRMGYAFRATRVAVAEGSSPSSVDITVTVEQVGVAPFYYPLGIALTCPGGRGGPLPGVEALVARGDAASFTFADLPATARCLGGVSIALASGYAYPGNPVRFAQGADGRTVEVSLPLPPGPPPPTAAPPTGVGSLSCGNPGRNRCGGSTHRLAPHSERHPFRCCSGTRIGSGWLRRANCDVYAESLLPCEAATYDDASAICGEVGARLCTKEEYEGKCTRGTGCQYDKELLWSSTAPDPVSFTRITYDDFEPPNRWGNFIDGGANARIYTRPTTNGGNDAFRRGSGSASLSNKKGDASSIFTRDLTAEVSFFGEIKVKFWAYVFSFEKDEDFFLEYTMDGTTWIVAAQYINNDNVANNEPKDFEVVLSDHSGSPLALDTARLFQIRFRCDASGGGDIVYIDNVEILGRLN